MQATVSLHEVELLPSVGSDGVFTGANATVSFGVVSGLIASKSGSLALQRILSCLIFITNYFFLSKLARVDYIFFFFAIKNCA